MKKNFTNSVHTTKRNLLVFVMSMLSVAMMGQAYMAPDGALFSGVSAKGAKLTPYIYAPYQSSYTWTSLSGAGDWRDGKHTATGTTEFTVSGVTLGGADSIPTFTTSESSYQYGSSATSGKKVYYGTASYASMTSGQYYANGSAKGAVTKFSGITSWRIYFFNSPENVISINNVYIPITTNSSSLSQSDLFPEGAQMTVKIHPATCTRAADGTYTKSYTKSTVLASTTLTESDYTPYSATATYYGALVWTLSEPLSITGAFMIELSGINLGDEARMSQEGVNKTTTQYVKDSKLYATNSTLVSVNAMFPALYKNDEVNTISFSAEGGAADKVILRANVTPSEWVITKPDWITYETSMASSSFSSVKNNYITFTAEANTGAAREGTITVSNRGKEVTYKVEQAARSVDCTIPTSGIATFSANFDATIPDGVTAYYASQVNGGYVHMEEIADKIKAGTGVVLVGTAGESYKFVYTTDAEIVDGNLLVATDGETVVPAGKYIMKNGEFHPLSADYAIAKGKAYLDYTAPSDAKLVIDWGEATGIIDVAGNKEHIEGVIYNLNGVRVNDSYKGIVISNGKKIIRK